MLVAQRTAFALVVLLTACAFPATPKVNPSPASCCSVVESALDSANSLHRGMKRSDVEKDFVLDGGISTATVANYVYRQCPTIKIEVGFERVGADGQFARGGPNDIVKYVSRPFLDYPVKD
jgi:hypothetical protein